MNNDICYLYISTDNIISFSLNCKLSSAGKKTYGR